MLLFPIDNALRPIRMQNLCKTNKQKDEKHFQNEIMTMKNEDSNGTFRIATYYFNVITF